MKGDIYCLGGKLTRCVFLLQAFLLTFTTATLKTLRIDFTDEALNALLTQCTLTKVSEISKRPSSIKILQTAREMLGKVSGIPGVSRFLPNAPEDMEYLHQAVLEILKRLFRSYRIHFMGANKQHSLQDTAPHPRWPGRPSENRGPRELGRLGNHLERRGKSSGSDIQWQHK